MPAMSSRRSHVPWNIVIVAALGIAALGLLLLVRSRAAEPGPDPSIAPSGSPSGISALEAILATPPASGAPGLDTDHPKGQILSKTALADAIGVARPLMTNTVGRLDMGSAVLSIWASRSLTWEALEALPETSPALFKKDPDAERGKRFCLSGTILEIRAEKTLAGRLVEDRPLPLIDRPSSSGVPPAADTTLPSVSAPGSSGGLMPRPDLSMAPDLTIPDGGKVYVATLQSKPLTPPPSAGKVKLGQRGELVFVEIVAVRSSGSLVDGDDARVCGILTGVTVPPTGGAGASVMDGATEHRVVGMFDLPQNHGVSSAEATAQHGG